MPWCDPCERFFNPNSVRLDGSCPTCGTKLEEPPAGSPGTEPPRASARTQREPPDTGWRSVPWHFWLLVAALAFYLGWRLVQGVLWVLGRF